MRTFENRVRLDLVGMCVGVCVCMSGSEEQQESEENGKICRKLNNFHLAVGTATLCVSTAGARINELGMRCRRNGSLLELVMSRL